MRRVAAATLLTFAAISGAVASNDGEVARLRDEISRERLRLRAREGPAASAAPSEPSADVLTTILTLPIELHRRVISPQDGDSCTFTPSCSTFALEALRETALLGWARASDRLLRCHVGNESEYPSRDGYKYDPANRGRASRSSRARTALGAFLSVVPGLGQAIGGSPTDGVQALTTIGFFGIGAVAYGRRGERAKAILAGTAAGVFYVGNIYGGARAFGAGQQNAP